MLKTRIIPTLLFRDVGLVKGVAFDSWRRVGAPMQAVKVFNMRDVDELVLLDIGAIGNNQEPDYDLVESLAEECMVPLTVGGGVLDSEMVRLLLLAGADKVSINTAAYENPSVISESAKRFGVQCVVASIDCRKNEDGSHQCFSHCGTVATGKEVVSWARELESLGAGEILLTSIDRDGTMEGFDLELVRKVTSEVSIPVIASGGAGNYEDIEQAISLGKASAVSASSIYLFTEATPLDAKKYLAEKGIPVRNSAVR